MKNLSRRSFVKTAVAAAALSGLAVTAAGCTNSGNSGNAGAGAVSAADIEPKPETEQLVCALLGKDLKIACVIIAAGVAGVLGGSLLAERADSVFAPVSATAVSAEPTAAPTPQPTPEPTPEPTPVVETVRFSATGDDLIHE